MHNIYCIDAIAYGKQHVPIIRSLLSFLECLSRNFLVFFKAPKLIGCIYVPTIGDVAPKKRKKGGTFATVSATHRVGIDFFKVP